MINEFRAYANHYRLIGDKIGNPVHKKNAMDHALSRPSTKMKLNKQQIQSIGTKFKWDKREDEGISLGMGWQGSGMA